MQNFFYPKMAVIDAIVTQYGAKKDQVVTMFGEKTPYMVI